MIKKIGVLTSGGDAPGMNAAIRAVARTAINNDIEVFAVYDGYKGLVENNLKKMNVNSVSSIINRGGTILGSARLKEFADDKVAQIAVDNLKASGIEALVTLGGDGTYCGALKLSGFGINCVGVPCTIDNDITSTDYTIGFDTAVNTAVEAIDRLRDTSHSHQRCSIVEVMGRYCGDIAVASGIASGAEAVVTADNKLSAEEIIDVVMKAKQAKKRHAIIIITEHVMDVHKLATEIESATGFETRATVLGHIQRGGSPTANDRVLAARLGEAAVKELINGQTGICMGIKNGEVVATPITEALKMKKDIYGNVKSLVSELA